MKHPFLVAMALLVAARLPAQAGGDLQVSLADGSTVVGELVEWSGEGLNARLVVESEGKRRPVPLAEVLALHGTAPRPPRLAEVHLVGGDVLRGEVTAGDRSGESFEVLCPVLDRMTVPVDRVSRVLWQPDRAGADDLRLPEGIDEALFLPAAIGLDKVSGILHRFTDRGVMFAVQGAEEPRLYPYGELVGLAIRDGFPRPAPARVELVTRTGDRVRVDVQGLEEGRLLVELESGDVVPLPIRDVSAITLAGGDRTFLSELDPVQVDEVGYAGERLHPFRRDRSATGGFLVSGGLTHGRGLGVHSRSVLVFRVPDGAAFFHAQVGLDDEVRALRPRPHVEVRVEVDGKEVRSFELEGGDPPRNLGLLPVAPGARLSLVVDFGRGQDLADRVDWLSAVFLPDPKK